MITGFIDPDSWMGRIVTWVGGLLAAGIGWIVYTVQRHDGEIKTINAKLDTNHQEVVRKLDILLGNYPND